MLSGVRAFRRDTPAETMTAVLKEDPRSCPIRFFWSPLALERIVASLPGEESGTALPIGERFSFA